MSDYPTTEIINDLSQITPYNRELRVKMVNPELNNSPALRISNVVYGRERRKDGRVAYLL